MLICLHKKKLGTNKNLLYDGEEYSWSSSIPSEAWIYGTSDAIKSVDALLDFLNIPHPSIGCELHKRAFLELIGSHAPELPWHAVLPNKKFQDMVGEAILCIENALESFITDQYYGNFMLQREFLLGLSRACIDIPKLNRYINNEKSHTIVNTLRSFFPIDDKIASTCVYDQGSTVTGRLTVKSGPQILILSKQYRDIIKSRYRNGNIVQIDFISLEPRIARLMSGKEAANDVYTQLSKEIFNSSLSREQSKLAVLCTLYGVSKKKLSGMLGSDHDPTTVINKIKEFFGVKEVIDSVSPQLKIDGTFRNYFGRKIKPDRDDPNLLLNYYIQSSAADAATLGFVKLLKKIQKNDLNCLPLFVIHDALLLDVHPDSMSRLGDLAVDGIEVPTLGDFPVTISNIS